MPLAAIDYGNDCGTTVTCSTVTNGVIWTNWNTSATTANAITITDTGIWAGWNQTAAATITVQGTVVGNEIVWASWNNGTQIGTPHRTPIQLTPEQQAAMERQRRLAKELEQERHAAEERAERILREHLDEEQRETLEKESFFYLRSSSGKRYRIERKWSHNVRLLDDKTGKVIKTYCAHPRQQTPVADSMLVQKLWLEAGLEEEFLKIANVS